MKVSETQCLQFPRYELYIDGILIAETTIPDILKQAQCRLVMEINAGIDIMPTRTGASIKKETVGPISVEYSEGAGGLAPEMSMVEALLDPLYGTKNVGITTIRV